MRRVLKGVLGLVGLVVLAVVGLLGYLSVTEYQPAEVETLSVSRAARNADVQVGDMLTVVTLNTGYASLSREMDFFMDGGQMTRPESKAVVEENISGLLGALSTQNADVIFLQEVDTDSYRSYYTDQLDAYRRGLGLNAAFAYNYQCDFVPIPWPPIGKVSSGLATLTGLNVTEATRESLPVPFTWPVRVANLKRCLLVERVPVAGTEKELVLINLHLEAYDSGEGKAAQTAQLMEILRAEYRNGNYVIAGGDFNQTFESAQSAYPILEGSAWMPGSLQNSDLPSGFSYMLDKSTPTCRLLNKPYDGDRSAQQFYVIDGFIISDNLKVNHVETIDLNFRNSDHNPVLLQVTLK